MTEKMPAFPSPDWNGSWQGPDANHGMSLRDWFAGQALAGILPAAIGKANPLEEAVAYGAYQIADAMLAERSKEQSS